MKEIWRGDRPKPRPGNLGGGSGHVGFLCPLCIPSISLAARGAEGVVYHSNYDTLEWYRSNVGEDYAGALMLTRICGQLVADLADAPVLPLRPTAVVGDLEGRLDGIATAAANLTSAATNASAANTSAFPALARRGPVPRPSRCPICLRVFTCLSTIMLGLTVLGCL